MLLKAGAQVARDSDVVSFRVSNALEDVDILHVTLLWHAEP